MGRLIELISEWEIQILVLLSFTVQLFLFFGGRLRRGNSNRFLRLCLWAAYLGADLAAVYALGYLSRRQDVSIDRNLLTGTQPLGFFWAPFLLIHLGGQDTITAFAMEDNNLWKRHLLNLVTQVVLALYVFWKSIGKHSAKLLLAGSFVFVAGIIKYGERIWSLKSGSLQSIESSDKDRYNTKWPDNSPDNSRRVDGGLQDALDSMADVLEFLSDRRLLNTIGIENSKLREIIPDPDKIIWKVSLQLGMIYDDVYTKSFVLRSWTGAILRCISQAAVIVAFVVFLVSDKVTYGKADIAISYSLFVGCLFLEICSMAVSMMSPWTWAWFKGKECEGLASLFLFVLRRDIGYPKMKQRWPNLIGQYNFYSWLSYREQQRRKYSQRIMILFKMLSLGLFRVRMEKLLWMSKVLDTEYMHMDSTILKRVVEEIRYVICAGGVDEEPFLWQNTARVFKDLAISSDFDFGWTIAGLHVITEKYLEKLDSSDAYKEAKRSDVTLGLMDEVCKKLSLYMMYLLVTQPSMLPLSVSAGATLDRFQKGFNKEDYLDPGNQKSVVEVARMWMRLLIYAAGKSRTASHVAQLGRGGELITFIWLVMAHSGTGETQKTRIQLFKSIERIKNRHTAVQYAFALPSADEDSDAHHRSGSEQGLPTHE